MAQPLSQYLRMYRKRSGLSQLDVGMLLGHERRGGEMSRHERGLRVPTLQTALIYAALFRVPAKVLFRGLYNEAEQALSLRIPQLRQAIHREGVSLRAQQKLTHLADLQEDIKRHGIGTTSFTMALAPWRKGFGFAVLEGSERLVDWGIAVTRDLRSRTLDFIDLYRPDLIVLDEPTGTKRDQHTRGRLTAIKNLVEERRIEVKQLDRTAVTEEFRDTGSRSWEIATALASFFPELGPVLPSRYEILEGQDERVKIFEAVALAVTELRAREWKKPS